MSLQRQFGFWVGALVVFIGLIWLFSGALMPFIAGLAVAYFLDPVADRLERLGLPRWIATSVILLAFVLALILVLILIVPILVNQMNGFIERAPGYVTQLQAWLAEINQGWLGQFVGERLPEIQRQLGEYAGQGAAFLGRFAASIWSGGQAIASVIGVIVITPVVAFYLLLDWDHMVEKVDGWLPRHHAATIRRLIGEIDRAIAGFVRGQAIVCLLLGLFYGVGLTLIGLSFGFLIGLGAGLISFIPFVGSILGLIVALGVAIVQFWPDWHMLILVAVVFGVGQFIEGNILSPRLVGSSVGLHPVWLMFSLLAFGSLFGFLGLMVAVPVAAAIGVLVRFALQQYLGSVLYTGVPRGRPVIDADEADDIP